jgi:hypothetical protein
MHDMFPMSLPPFRHHDLQTLHPTKGDLTNPNDQEKIALLMAPLNRAMGEPSAPGYIPGMLMKRGCLTGGYLISGNGDSYSGDWAHGNMERAARAGLGME